jgi:hypothetical protein
MFRDQKADHRLVRSVRIDLMLYNHQLSSVVPLSGWPFPALLIFPLVKLGGKFVNCTHDTTWVSSVRRYEFFWQTRLPTMRADGAIIGIVILNAVGLCLTDVLFDCAVQSRSLMRAIAPSPIDVDRMKEISSKLRGSQRQPTAAKSQRIITWFF